MLKIAQILNISPTWLADIPRIEAALNEDRFTECGATQETSSGWIEPRGEAHGPLLENVGGQLVLKLKTEVKSVPATIISQRANDRSIQIEASTGRKPGKKEISSIKDEIKLELLPVAFPKQSTTLVWIDPDSCKLVIGATSTGKVDEVLTLLVKSFEGLAPSFIETNTSPIAAMSEWLTTHAPPKGFSVDHECELKAADNSNATIRFGKSQLDTDEVKNYVESGKLPIKLALTWDERVSFVLTEKGALNKIDFLDVVLESQSAVEKDSGFDANVAIATGEMRKLIPDLLAALGGETNLKIDAAQSEGARVTDLASV